jgi:hypothetical protein
LAEAGGTAKSVKLKVKPTAPSNRGMVMIVLPLAVAQRVSKKSSIYQTIGFLSFSAPPKESLLQANGFPAPVE